MTDFNTQPKERIYIYSNQPIVRYKGHCYSKLKNFVDFVITLSRYRDSYSLVLPCEDVTDIAAIDGLTEVPKPEKFIKAHAYEGHGNAIKVSLKNALLVNRIIREDIAAGVKVVVAGPGPNSFLFWLSILLPCQVRYAFFIRGDTLKTVQNIYSGTPLYYFASGLVRLFRSRINCLLKKKRAVLFAYGDHLLQQYCTDSNQGHVVMPLLDDDFVIDDSTAPVNGRKAFRVLFVGRLSPEKNVLALIEACHEAVQAGRPFQLSIVGYGPLEEAVQEAISKHLNLDRYVEFVGYVAHGAMLKKIIDDHDVLCLPSFTEGIPRSVIEAFARKKPVVATPVGALPTLFSDSIVFINGFDSAGIFKAIDWAMENKADLKRMAGKGHASSRCFSISYNAEQVDRVLFEYSCDSGVFADERRA